MGIETLTDEQRAYLGERCGIFGQKALRIIDQLAAALADKGLVLERHAALQDECERLRAIAEAHVSDNMALDGQVAAANALLDEWSRGGNSMHMLAVLRRTRAHLAGQAAPEHPDTAKLRAANALLKQAYNFVCTGKRKADLYEALRAYDGGALWRDCCEDPTPSVDAAGQRYCEACDSDLAKGQP